ncbi:MAG: DUF6273 domain-containing protein [Butyrivibrio sp.]|nr:DUF6273 domain-containing protein [Butyrivibrio sp.]
MREETKRILESIDELKKAIEEGTIRVEDELITKDKDGTAIFVVADIRDGWITFVRKFVLQDDKPMKRKDFDLIQWLNSDYMETLDKDLKAIMVAPDGQQLMDLPREIEVFGKNEYGVKEEGSRWEYFKKLNTRICGTGDDAEYSEWWWLNTPHRASAAHFCNCNDNGLANYAGASSASFCVRPRFILAQRNQ